MLTQQSITSFFEKSRYAQPFAEDTDNDAVSQMPRHKSPEPSQIDEKEAISIEEVVALSEKASQRGSEFKPVSGKVTPKKKLRKRLSSKSETTYADSNEMPLTEQSVNTILPVKKRDEKKVAKEGYWTEDECE